MSVGTLEKHGKEREATPAVSRSTLAGSIEAVGRHSTRYGLVLVLFWIGGMKFTAYEAEAI